MMRELTSDECKIHPPKAESQDRLQHSVQFIEQNTAQPGAKEKDEGITRVTVMECRHKAMLGFKRY